MTCTFFAETSTEADPGTTETITIMEHLLNRGAESAAGTKHFRTYKLDRFEPDLLQRINVYSKCPKSRFQTPKNSLVKNISGGGFHKPIYAHCQALTLYAKL